MILVYKYKPEGVKEDFKIINSKEELIKFDNPKWLFLYENNRENLFNIISFAINKFPTIKFIPLIDSANVDIIPKIMALGAYTFIMQPFKKNFEKALRYIKEEDSKEDKNLEFKKIFHNIVGVSDKIKQIFELIEKIAPTDSTVLILGESGTGKELVAKAIYKLSKRNNMPFIPVNCGAIPENLLESELFGYAKGAFTGALNKKIGRFEAANNGRIFLDEISEMPMPLQVKLLRVIQEREVQPIGSNSTVKINVRIIAASNKNLEKLVEENKFREDLYYRLNVIPILIPPLRERKEDIEELTKYFFKKFTKTNDKADILKGFADETIWMLKNYNWPGNVRELENTVERLVVLTDEGYILPSDLPEKFFDTNFEPNEVSDKEYLNSLIKLDDDGVNLKEIIDNIETSLIMQALEKTGGVKDKAAKLLSMKRTTLIEKLKRKNLL
jgi:transcriptional regulator with PAS, ATPase and Fis domain